MAALISADLVLGTRCTEGMKMGDLNRRLGYRKGRCTPINAPMTPQFTRFIAPRGLDVVHSNSASGAFNDLKRITASEDCSFPIVGVDLELLPEYDRRVTIRRIPSPAGVEPPSSDHALVVLSVDDNEVQFFDPTLRDPTSTLVEEKIDTPTFLKRWNGDPIVANDRVWFARLPVKPGRKERRRGRTLMDYHREEARLGA
jgi:hypothetical protein